MADYRQIIDPRLLPDRSDTADYLPIIDPCLMSSPSTTADYCSVIDPRLLLPGLPIIGNYLAQLAIQEAAQAGIPESQAFLSEPQTRNSELIVHDGEESKVAKRLTQSLREEDRTGIMNFSNDRMSTGGLPVTMPALDLPDEVFAAMANKSYDALWMRNLNVDTSQLESFLSNKTFEALCNNGVLKEGDELYHMGTYKTAQGSVQVEKIAKVGGMFRTGSNPKKSYPHVTIISEGVPRTEIQLCRGPSYILEAFNKIEPFDAFASHHCWYPLRVRRGTIELGRLHDVRQAYHFWQREMDTWAATKRVQYRQRRAKRRGKSSGYDQVHDYQGPVNPGLPVNKRRDNVSSYDQVHDNQGPVHFGVQCKVTDTDAISFGAYPDPQSSFTYKCSMENAGYDQVQGFQGFNNSTVNSGAVDMVPGALRTEMPSYYSHQQFRGTMCRSIDSLAIDGAAVSHESENSSYNRLQQSHSLKDPSISSGPGDATSVTLPSHQHPQFHGPVQPRIKNANNVDMDSLTAYHHSLSNNQYESLAFQRYDNLWMQKHSINPAVLKSFISKHKFEFLILHGALKVGDHLYVTVQGHIPVEKVGIITSSVGKGKPCPNVSIVSAGVQHTEIMNCTGPAQILSAFNDIQPQNCFMYYGCWDVLKVRRGSLELGRLYDVRQAFGYYLMLIDGWSQATGRPYRSIRK